MLRADTKILGEKLMNFWDQNRNAVSVAVIALVLTILIFAARAAAPFAGFEAEGALGDGVIVKNDASASSGQYVEFVAQGSPANYSMDSVAVLGCSNTGQHAEGYRSVSTLDQLSNTTRQDIGGKTLQDWGSGPSNPRSGWGKVQQKEPAGGYEAAWFQICLRHDEHDGVMNSTHQEDLQVVIDTLTVEYRIDLEDIYLSPLNLYADGIVCNITGATGPLVAGEIADWGVSNLSVTRGPDTGPLQQTHLGSDSCHLSDEGKVFVGNQLVDFFDN